MFRRRIMFSTSTESAFMSTIFKKRRKAAWLETNFCIGTRKTFYFSRKFCRQQLFTTLLFQVRVIDWPACFSNETRAYASLILELGIPAGSYVAKEGYTYTFNDETLPWKLYSSIKTAFIRHTTGLRHDITYSCLKRKREKKTGNSVSSMKRKHHLLSVGVLY